MDNISVEIEELIALAEKSGFSHFGEMNVSALSFRSEVREMCESNRCHRYGTSWACPPHCGSLEDIREEASRFHFGFIVQTTGNMEDPFDIDCMDATEKRHNKNFIKFVSVLRSDVFEMLPLSAGSCDICGKCTCPDAPCKNPDLRMMSMEAAGIVVSDLCADSHLPYYYGPGTITFTSCVLFN